MAGVIDKEANQTVRVLSVHQDEPVQSDEDGDQSPDAFIQGDSVLIRTERSEAGNGRVYVIVFEAYDLEGTCTGSVTVQVPLGKKKVAVDDGAIYDSTGL